MLHKIRYHIIVSISLALISASSLTAQTVSAENGMVAAAHPLAAQAGVEILQQGGNAVDAAVAAAMVLAVVEPNASGLGGGGFLCLKMAGKDEYITIDYRETAPAAATPRRYYQSDTTFKVLSRKTAWSVGVPGVVAGLTHTLDKYGTRSLQEVVQPAIRYAREGFKVSANFESMIIDAYDLIFAHQATAAIYLNEGLPFSAGQVIVNPDLANTLQKLGQRGPNCFYNGTIAKAIESTMRKEGGILRLSDLKDYRALQKKPIVGDYRGYTIISSAPPSGGGTHLVELLNILEGFELRKLGHNSASYIHVLAEAMKMIQADKAWNMADPDFFDVPARRLTDKQYGASLREKINMDAASFDYRPPQWIRHESQSTTHLSVMDKAGNMVALTQSINLWFGSGITIEGTGIIMNNHIADFHDQPGHPNSVAPGKRPVSSIAPTLVLKDGQPFASLGTPGGSRIIGALAQIIINLIDFEMEIDAAIEAPRVHAFDSTLHVEGRIDETVVDPLRALGHPVKVHEDFDNYFGGAQGIVFDRERQRYSGGADSRRDGTAVGY